MVVQRFRVRRGREAREGLKRYERHGQHWQYAVRRGREARWGLKLLDAINDAKNAMPFEEEEKPIMYFLTSRLCFVHIN